MLFKAYVYCSSNRSPETDSRILFEADSAGAAVEQTGRWFENRHKAIPEAFGTLLCVKIYEVFPQKINDTGYLPPDTFMPCYEWKCDWGKPYGR